MSKCPIVVAIDDIRSGSRHSYSDDVPSVRVHGGSGGNGDTVTYTIDDIMYYLNTRTLAIARARLHKRDLTKLARAMFGQYHTRVDIFDHMMTVSTARTHARDQVVRLLSLTADFGDCILSHAIAHVKEPHLHMRKREYGLDSTLDLTLPTLNVDVDPAISSAHELVAITNAAIGVLNGINATSLGIPRVHASTFDIAPAPPYTCDDVIVIDTSADSGAEVDRLHAIELEIARDVNTHEKFFCALANHIADIQTQVYEAWRGV